MTAPADEETRPEAGLDPAYVAAVEKAQADQAHVSAHLVDLAEQVRDPLGVPADGACVAIATVVVARSPEGYHQVYMGTTNGDTGGAADPLLLQRALQDALEALGRMRTQQRA